MTLPYYTFILLSVQLPGAFIFTTIMLIVLIFIAVLVWNRVVYLRVRRHRTQTEMTQDMIEQAITISENTVIRMDMQENVIVNLFGHFLPEKSVPLDAWLHHVHPDDIGTADNFLRQLLEGHSGNEGYYFRWNANFGPGEPQWRYIHTYSMIERDPVTKMITGVISTLKDETKQQQEEEEEQELTYKYKQIFENSIIGLSFYTPDGWLMNSNKIMREICHFDSEDGDEFFSKMNLFDMSPFRECCDKNHIEELWICHQSIVPERDMCVYLEIRLHPIRDDVGNLMFLAIAARDVTEERDMYMQAKLNDVQIQKANEEIQRYETELRYMMDACLMRVWRSSFKDNMVRFYNGLSELMCEYSFTDLADYFLSDREQIALHFSNPKEFYTTPMSYVGRVRPLFGEGGDPKWVQLNSIPLYDKEGQLSGAFGLIRNINSLMQKQEQLKQETERANDAGRLKSVFLANMTHEIRTPLNAIVGFSDLLQAIDGPDEKREVIHLIHNNCDMLLRLTNDILLLSNADTNSIDVNPEETDVVRQFDMFCQNMSQRIEEPGVEFLKDNPYEQCVAIMDSDRIHQVFTNFVTNAVKYTHQGHIRLGYRIEERHGRKGFYAYCEDTGSGIPKDQCERIFERFVKLNDYIQGTGLGLSICKAIVEKYGGEIGVDSEMGKGSTFWFWVPAEIKSLKEKEAV